MLAAAGRGQQLVTKMGCIYNGGYAIDDNCSRVCALISDGPARPLGYPRETPTRGGPTGLGTPSLPWKEGLPAGEG